MPPSQHQDKPAQNRSMGRAGIHNAGLIAVRSVKHGNEIGAHAGVALKQATDNCQERAVQQFTHGVQTARSMQES